MRHSKTLTAIALGAAIAVTSALAPAPSHAEDTATDDLVKDAEGDVPSDDDLIKDDDAIDGLDLEPKDSEL